MRKIIITLLGILLLGICLCKNEAKEDYNTLDMVFVPASEKAEADDYKSLMDIVTKLAKIKFNFIKVTDYNAAVESMRSGRAKIAWFGAATYVIASKIADAEAFAAGVPKGQKDASYYTYFVVRKDSPIKTLADSKGKTLALNDIGSTSGDYIPQVELLKVGLNIKTDFKKVFYAGSHDAALMAVVNKQADICGMASHNYEGRIKDGTVNPNAVRIIFKSRKIPPAPLAYSKKLPLEVRKKIQDGVLNAHKYGKIGGWGGQIERYVAVNDKDYDIMREVQKLVEGNKK